MKHKRNLLIFLVLVNSFILLLAIETRAATYDLKLNENDSFVWEVTELQVQRFKQTFGFEPDFEIGDQMKITVYKVLAVSYGWSLTLKEWFFKSSFNNNGTISYASIYSDPSEYQDDIFVPSPVADYLAEAYKTLPSKYIISGTTVTRREQGYTMIKEYSTNGICVSESYLDDDGVTCVKIEGSFRNVPAGIWEPIAFMVIGISALIVVIIKKNKLFYK